MARTSDPHAATVKAWQTRARAAGGGTAVQQGGDYMRGGARFHVSEGVPVELHKLYLDYTGAGEERDYGKAKKRMVSFVADAVEGGPLEHLRPRNGITLYRARRKDDYRANVVESFSTNRAVAEQFAGLGWGHPGRDGYMIEEITVTPDLPAISLRKVQRGALAAEVLVVRDKKRRDSDDETEANVAALKRKYPR